MSLEDIKLALAIVIPLLSAGIGAYIKLKIDNAILKNDNEILKKDNANIKHELSIIKNDLNNIAFLIGTKRAKAEREKGE